MNELSTEAANWQIVAAVVIFLISYALFIAEKTNRAVIALAGAILMIVLGLVDFKAAYSFHLPWQTIFLLIGMMLLAGITSRTGIFQYLAVRAAQKAKGKPIPLLIQLSLLSAGFGALFDNVMTILLLVPVTLSLTKILKVNPVPFLIAEVISANLGGTATLIGNPLNMMIGSAVQLSFTDFLIYLGPVVVIILGAALLYFKLLFGKQLQVLSKHKKELMKLDAKTYITDKKLLIKSLIVLGLTLIGFLIHPVLHLDAAVIALAGATLLMLIGIKDHAVEEVLDSVEWVTVFFFAGLFVLVGGLMEAGVIRSLATGMLQITEGSIPFMAMLALWVTGLVSATIDNVPLVATMIPLVQDMGVQLNMNESALNPIWWSLALGASLGGNGTLLGASTNLIAAGMAKREGKSFSYMEFLKVGAPILFISLIISSLYIYFIVL
ncbi:ArsB/NhaD family transporter [Paenibacillus sp. J2TS4]|uniref:ArsB/NhaD family transporter n=1 Tax=Paenibacillus sp. J2TS4 TaxID=2807194 RepID=UPI001B2ED374|nr:ArsB/NhaD family transporter [Paenibacillus sp. J2TS4]GIP31397.1 membrane protein [Paenibacillus sp. J2TS4]